MKRYFSLIPLLGFLLLLTPVVVWAAEEFAYETALISEGAENALEFVNLIVAIIAAVYAVKLAALSQGGQLEKTWNKLAMVGVVFAVIEIFAALKGFGLVHLEGLEDILELVLAVLLLVAFVSTRRHLLEQVLGESGSQNQQENN